MKTLRHGLLTLFCALGISGTAAAQKINTISFETDCNGAPTPGNFDAFANKRISGSLYAACGVSSITSDGAGTQQVLAQSGNFRNIPNIDGSVALAGAADFGILLSSATSTATIVFSPPVNELSFSVLDLDNSSGLTISLIGAQGTPIGADEKPTPTGKTVDFARTSSTPIERVAITYRGSLQLVGGDGWYVDKLRYNAYVCGDGEVEPGEACDDGNRVQCDGCNNSCQPGIAGCFNGATCVAAGAVSGCTQCDAATPPGPSGEKPTTPRPAGTACDDGLFCTLAGACDASGTCVSPTNTCDDGVTCTLDSCDESSDSCLHPVADNSCLIAGSCYLNGQPNPTNKCELCSTASKTSWDKQPVGQQCGDPSCANGSSTAAATCSAAGVCTAGAATSCMFMTCANAISCDGLCTGDQNCPQQAHCLATTMMCVPDLTAGTACTRNNECASNFCTDGVCCDRSCTGACEACNQAGKLGMCTPAAAMSTDTLCSAGQLCSADGRCTSPVVVTPPPTTTPDKPPVMVDVRPMGTGCDRNEVCGSGVCRDGVCCDRACEGLCEACNVPGKVIGQCSAYELGQDPESECGGSGSVCDGQNACTEFETRGNGLCSAQPARQSQPRHGDAAVLASLLTLAATLLLRRKLAGSAPGSRTRERASTPRKRT